jgi:hypothetical protein
MLAYKTRVDVGEYGFSILRDLIRSIFNAYVLLENFNSYGIAQASHCV